MPWESITGSEAGNSGNQVPATLMERLAVDEAEDSGSAEEGDLELRK